MGPMTKPRRIEKGATYLITRRCSQRQYLLRPSEAVNEFFLFCLARGAERAGIDVHAYCVMSNHYHLVVTDVEGKLPDFLHWLNMFVGRGLNALHGRWESFWAPGSYSAVRLGDENDIMAKIVYTLHNPVAAGLVERGEHWPGLWSCPEAMLSGEQVVPRPGHFFSKNSTIPKNVTLRLTPPPGAAAQSFVKCTRNLLDVAGHQKRQQMAVAAKPFTGTKSALALDPFDQPESHAPRRELNPRVAAKDTWRRIEVLQQEQGFQRQYREAWAEFVSGKRDTLFPPGSYWMVQVAKQPAEAAT